MSVSTCRMEHEQYFPILGLLALATALAVYCCRQGELLQLSAQTAGALLTGAGLVQLVSALRSQRRGGSYAAAILLPLGIFWLSLISYTIFPALGLGRTPSQLTMFCYLSLWGLFMAILFLGSFRQALIVQILYGSMMFSFLALAIDYPRDDRVFLLIGCTTGIFASLAALLMALALCRFRVSGRRGWLLASIDCEPEPEQN